MEEIVDDVRGYQRLVRAIIIRGIKDLTLPFGFQNNKGTCRQAFNFLFNEKSQEYKFFCYWCDLADINPQYWQQLALMNLAYELNFKPWLRIRIVHYLRGVKYWRILKNYYCICCENEYQNFIEAIENDNND